MKKVLESMPYTSNPCKTVSNLNSEFVNKYRYIGLVERDRIDKLELSFGKKNIIKQELE